MSVAELLAASRAAHQRYRDALDQRTSTGSVIPGDPAAQGLSLTEAQRTRLEAHALDPEQTDPAWKADDDQALTHFYVLQLAR